MLVAANQMSLCNYMSLHGFFKVLLIRLGKLGQFNIERVQFEKIAVLSDGRAGAAVGAAMPVIDALFCARRQIMWRRRFIQASGLRGQVVQYPMYPGPLRSCRIRGVRVIDNQGQAFGIGRHAAP